MDDELVISAFGEIVCYLRETLIDNEVLPTGNFRIYNPMKDSSTLILDGQTLMNLEILQNNHDNSKKNTLLERLDNCLTPFGKRLFRQWLTHPLRSIVEIELRLDAVENLFALIDIRDYFKHIGDADRYLSRVHVEASK